MSRRMRQHVRRTWGRRTAGRRKGEINRSRVRLRDVLRRMERPERLPEQGSLGECGCALRRAPVQEGGEGLCRTRVKADTRQAGDSV